MTQACCPGPNAVTWTKHLINARGHRNIRAQPHTLLHCRAPSWAGQNSLPAPTWRVARGDGDGRGAACPGGDGRGGRAPHCPSSVRGHARLPRCSPPVGMGRGMRASAWPEHGPPQPVLQHPPTPGGQSGDPKNSQQLTGMRRSCWLWLSSVTSSLGASKGRRSSLTGRAATSGTGRSRTACQTSGCEG